MKLLTFLFNLLISCTDHLPFFQEPTASEKHYGNMGTISEDVLLPSRLFAASATPVPLPGKQAGFVRSQLEKHYSNVGTTSEAIPSSSQAPRLPVASTTPVLTPRKQAGFLRS